MLRESSRPLARTPAAQPSPRRLDPPRAPRRCARAVCLCLGTTMPKTPTRAAPDEDADAQDDPANAAELERLRAKLARHKREAERLAELIREKQGKR